MTHQPKQSRRHNSICIARKPWKCDGCGKIIQPGTRYLHSADSPSGRNERHECMACAKQEAVKL